MMFSGFKTLSELEEADRKGLQNGFHVSSSILES